MTAEQQHEIEPTSEVKELAEPETPTDTADAPRGKPGWLLPVGAIALLAIGLLGWRAVSLLQAAPEEETASDIEQARLAVRTVPANLEPIQAWTYGDGFVNATVKKHLTFQADGTIDFIKSVNGRDLREGDRIRQGELLARLDRRKQNADITVATAEQTEAKNQVTSAIASLRRAEEALAQAEADLQKAKADEAFARADLKRYRELAAEGGIAQREVDVRETEYENAQAATLASEAGVRSAETEIRTAQTQVEIAEAGVNSADARLTQSFVDREDTELIAPFDGIVSRININQGEYWTTQIVNSAVGDYQSIVERLPIIVIDPNQFEIDIELASFQGAQVQPGQRALIILDRDRAQTTIERVTGEDLERLASARGTVFSVSPSVSPGARSVRVTLRVTEGAEQLQDGERVSAWIATAEKAGATVAPFNAFVSRDRQLFVFVVDEETGTVEQRAVRQGIEGLAKREILEGVRPGEKLVTDGKTRLVNGAPVEVITQ